ncbi:MAG: antiterminator LoaP [Treponema sp.]|nr:antiterminator LoaP [Treponema sp.]
MKYFALQVKTNQEEAFINKVSQKSINIFNEVRFIFPKRQLTIRKNGKTKKELKSIFPGYLFIETNFLSTELYNIIKSTPNFYRFLPNNSNILPMHGKDLIILQHFLTFGDVIESSKITFDDNDRIVIKEGPLKGLEGNIIKVDRRKKRAKVKLDFANDNFILDLAFEVMNINENDSIKNKDT